MQKHTRIYYKYFDYGMDDVILCEVCGSPAVDIHHLDGRYKKDSNNIEKLIALCRLHHDDAHANKLTKEQLLTIHERTIKLHNHKF